MSNNFTFYPTFSVDDLRDYMPDVPVLLPASSWARKGLETPKLPEHIRNRATNKGADCGGFVATRIWGDYRYTPAEYVDWLSRWEPSWAATMDYCCESPITGGYAEVVEKRQARTTEMVYHFWNSYRNVPWVWVPTLQGWNPEDYRKHALELSDLFHEMQAYYGPGSEWRVGIGTLCARASVKTINAVLHEVRAVLPDMPFHTWGLKKKALESIDLTNIVSSDSAVWHELYYEKRDRARNAAHALGISRRKYTITVQLPAYIAKVQAATYRAPALSSQADLTSVRALLGSLGWTLHLRTRARTEYIYIARRVSGKLQEEYIGSLIAFLKLSTQEQRAKVQALGSPASSFVYSGPTLWDDLEMLGNPTSPYPCPTDLSTCLVKTVDPQNLSSCTDMTGGATHA